MTNLEWLRSLSVDELGNAILWSRCNLCVYQNSDACPTNPTNKEGHYDCMSGFKEWCNAIHIHKIKPCANCGGKAMFNADAMGINSEIGYVQCCECHIRTSVGRKSDVINTWNRRADNGHE